MPGVGVGRSGNAVRLDDRVEQDLADVHRVDAVDQGEVGLGDQGEPVVGQTLDQVHLPQRPGPIQPPGHDPPDELPELGRRPGPRQRRAPHVVGEVEVLVVHPDRPGQPGGHAADPLPVAGHEGDAFADQGDQTLVVERLTAGIEDVHRADMARRVCRVQGQQRHLDRSQALRHDGPPLHHGRGQANTLLPPQHPHSVAAGSRGTGPSGCSCSLGGRRVSISTPERAERMWSLSSTSRRVAWAAGGVAVAALLTACTSAPEVTATPSPSPSSLDREHAQPGILSERDPDAQPHAEPVRDGGRADRADHRYQDRRREGQPQRGEDQGRGRPEGDLERGQRRGRRDPRAHRR